MRKMLILTNSFQTISRGDDYSNTNNKSEEVISCASVLGLWRACSQFAQHFSAVASDVRVQDSSYTIMMQNDLTVPTRLRVAHLCPLLRWPNHIQYPILLHPFQLFCLHNLQQHSHFCMHTSHQRQHLPRSSSCVHITRRTTNN